MCRGLAREGPAEEDSAPARARRRIEKGVVGMLDLGAATAAARAALGLLLEHAPSSPPVPRGEALAAAREEAARLLCVSGALDDAAAASTPCSTAATATDPSPPGEQMTLPPLAGHGGPSDSVASKRAAAAAAFAQSLQKTKKPRWGGSNELAVRESVQGSADKDAEAAKLRQALTVSELSTKLSAFRKDRGVAEVPSSTRLSIKVPLPEADASGRERNWVGILIGREGINKKRFEQQTGSTIALRGKGAMLRSQKKDDDTLEPLHVVLEADTQEALDYARVQVSAGFHSSVHCQAALLPGLSHPYRSAEVPSVVVAMPHNAHIAYRVPVFPNSHVAARDHQPFP
eukprot:scaffold289489_cov30-Tisochrysis_lutea.AAC.1